MTPTEKIKSFERLLEIIILLREKCPWDSVQTNETLRKYTIEEVYELADAILKNDQSQIKNELGDLLLHIVLYAKIGEEQNRFDIGDVINGLIEKLIVRHPHIFGDEIVHNQEDVIKNWENIKLKEGGSKGKVLNGVPHLLPALVKAIRIQEKAKGVGFDWETREQVWQKVTEEIVELEKEISENNVLNIEEEFGDLIFSIVNASRLYDIDPELALERTNQKFIRRFNYIEEKTIENGKNLKGLNLEEMELLWQEAKMIDKL